MTGVLQLTIKLTVWQHTITSCCRSEVVKYQIEREGFQQSYGKDHFPAVACALNPVGFVGQQGLLLCLKQKHSVLVALVCSSKQSV
jgi:hypothetical protein